MKAAWIVSAAVALLCSGGAAQSDDAGKPGKHAAPAGSSLQIILAIDAHNARLLEVQPIGHAIPPRFLEVPRLSVAGAAGLPAGTREIVAAIYTADRRLAALHGWPATGLEHYDQLDPEVEGRMTGRVSYPVDNERTIGFPLPEGATWLLLLTATLEDPRHPPGAPGAPPAKSKDQPRFPVWTGPASGSARLRIVLRPFAALLVGPRPTDIRRGRITLDPPFPDFDVIRVDPSIFLPVFAWHLPGGSVCPPGNGTFEPIDHLYGITGPASQRFNVVILGDGFDDRSTLDSWAAEVKNAFLNTEPFKSLEAKIDIDLIPVISGGPGVSYCPDSVARASHFGVEGQWTRPDGTRGGPGYFGTHYPCRIRQAVEKLAPYADIEVVVMIANCDEYGGKAEPDNKLVFVPIRPGKLAEFRGLTLHESGHALERLGEEYVACAVYDPLHTYPTYFPNIVPEPQSATAWWKSLLNANEKSGVDFRAVHKCGDNIDQGNLTCQNCYQKMTGGASETMLGLYWGAQYGTENLTMSADECPNGCYPFGAASCGYYRPMERCKMRSIWCAYCRACEERIRAGIKLAAPP
jgi:hypothetical protein